MNTWTCSGERAALLAGEGDMGLCVDCQTETRIGAMRLCPTGLVCEACHEVREQDGRTTAAFGESPRRVSP